MIVVSDASPLNVLVRIGYSDVLCPLFGSVIIPTAVASELSHAGTPEIVRDWLAHCPAWLEIRSPSRIDETLQMDDPGEVEAISLALELGADFLLADDRKARRAARERGIPITGGLASSNWPLPVAFSISTRPSGASVRPTSRSRNAF